MFDINTNQGYFIHLIKCTLNGEQPLEKPDDVSFDEIYKIAKRQNMLNLVWYSIEKLNILPSEKVFANWSNDTALLLNRTAFQELELEIVAQVFLANGYKIMPLKGSQIKEYYPESDMRVMGDVDILVSNDGTQGARDKVKEIMFGLGYEVEILNDGQVDSYQKGNVVMEIHFEFMAENHPHYDDFCISWDLLEQTDVENMYKMSIEDLYYYNIGHFIKDMSTKGCGVKPVVDAYVLWKNMNDEQKNIANQKLEKAELKDVSDKILKVAGIWFDDIADDGKTENIQKYFLDNATYGYEKNREVLNVLKENASSVKSGLFTKYLKRIFPPVEELYFRFGIKHKIFILLPFLWLLRIILLPFQSKYRKDTIKTEIEKTKLVTDDDVNFFRSVYEEFKIDYNEL